MGKHKNGTRVTIRLADEDVALLDEIAAEAGWTRHALLVAFVTAQCAKKRKERSKR